LTQKAPPFDIEYLNTTWLLSAAVRQGARVFNQPGAIREHSEKLSITEYPDLIPPTLVTRDLAEVEAFHARHLDIVINPSMGWVAWGYFGLEAMALI